MFEAASLASLYFGFAVLHAANAARLPCGFPLVRAWGRGTLRIVAVLAFAVGVWLFHWNDDVTSACLLALTAFSGVATLFVLLVPVFPRIIWGLAVASPLLGVGLVLLGIYRG
jgi:hypothetical protein